jgi:RNA polymerase sigma factor (sigma-70 family)
MPQPFTRVLRFLYRQSGGEGSRTAPSDGELLASFVSGRDPDAFGLLLDRHSGLVWHTCRRLLPDEADAQDAFQATFLVLLRRAGSLDGSRSLAGWLYGVARRVAQRARIRATRRREQERQLDMNPAAPDSDPREDIRPFLDAELAELPEKYRAPLVLCYLEGKTNEQAAEELGWPAGSMSSRLARGRELLRERLLSRGFTLSVAALSAVLAENSASAVPTSLLDATRLAASGFVTGNASAAGFSAAAVALAKGVVLAMQLSRIKIAAAVLLASLSIVGGAALGIHQALAARNVALAPLPDIRPRPAEDPFAGAQRLLFTFSSTEEPFNAVHPVATVGQFPDEVHDKMAFDRHPGKPRLALDGKCRLTVPYERQPLDVLTVSPTHNSGESWEPVRLYRKGDVFTLVLESWTDDRGRLRNVTSRTASLVRLAHLDGALPAGEYKLRLVWRTMYREFANPTQQFTISEQSVGELGFMVYEEGAKGKGKAALATLAEKDLQKSALTDAERAQKYQRPVNVTEGKISTSKDLKIGEFNVRAGTFNLAGWNQKEVPQLAAATVASPLYASILGPQLTTSDAVRLREIRWKDRTVTLCVELFHDQEGRKKYYEYHPILVVPLQPPMEKANRTVAGDYVVEVEWIHLSAETNRQPYTVTKTTIAREKFKVD